jgi:hypothetical protein
MTASGRTIRTPPRTPRAAGTPLRTPPRTPRAAGTPLAAVILILCSAQPLFAQPKRAAVRPDRVTVSGGVTLNGAYGLGDPRAELRHNSVGAPSPFTFFRIESALDTVAGVEARVGYAVTSLVTLEVGGTYARPQVSIAIFQDPETDARSLVTEKLSQYVVDASGVFHLPYPTLGRRARAYVVGGGSYLRQLHEDRLLVETGRGVHIGGGVRYWLRGSAQSPHAFGLRGEVRYVRRFGGVDFEDKSRGYPAVSLLVFAGF